jgi:hypothetical protein
MSWEGWALEGNTSGQVGFLNTVPESSAQSTSSAASVQETGTSCPIMPNNYVLSEKLVDLMSTSELEVVIFHVKEIPSATGLIEPEDKDLIEF